MKSIVRTVLFLFVTCVLQAQIRPICDVDCGPAPTPTPSGGGGGTTTTPSSFTSLSGQSDQRGFGNVRAAVAQTGGAVTVQGSQSYTYTIPMFSVPGRAGSNLNLNLYYNSHVWIQGAAGMMLGIDRDTPSPGFQLNFGFLEWNPAPGTPNGVLSTPDGTKHTLSVLYSDLVQDPNTGLTSCINQICQYVSDDSSYYFVSRPLGTKSGQPCSGPTNCPAPDVTVTDSNGTTSLYESFAVVTNDGPDEFVMRPYKFTDRNGNFITITYVDVNSINISTITDTVGRVTNFVYNADGTLQCVTDAGPTCNTSTGPLGKIPLGPGREFTFNWDTSHSIQFNFAGQATALVGATLYNITSGFTLPMLTSVCRPDTTCVKFNYGDWGIVNGIQEFGSDGTTVRYELSYDFPLASAGQLTANPTYTNETETTNGKTVKWSTSVSIDTATGLLASSTITDPHGLSTTTLFSHNGPPDWHDGLPTEIDMVDNSLRIDPCLLGPCPTILKRNLTWTSDPSPSYPPGSSPAAVNRANPHPATIVTVLEDGSQKQVSYGYDVPSGNVTDLQETDFGATAPGPLLRETVTSYQTVGFHILGMPKDVQVKDGSGKVVSHNVMAYDETATQSVPTSVTGHDDLGYPAGNTLSRGNLTSVITYPNAANTTGGISTTYVYDMLGNRISQIQGGIKTALNFSSITDYAYPDSVVQDPQGATPLTTSFTYSNRGQVLTRTDWNNQTTQFGYDTAGRPSTVKTPDNVTVTTQYDDAAANPAVHIFNSVNPSSVAVHTTDFLGNAVSDQMMNGTTPVSTTTYDDDRQGNVKVSNPFGPGETPIYKTSTYDVFGRTTSVLPPAITAGQAQQPYSIQLHGNTKTITDPANHQRREIVNGLGQLIEVDVPGVSGGAAATGSGTVSGTELSVPSTSASNGATAGTASVTIGGTTDRSTTVITQVATPTKITVAIGGQDGTNTTTSTLCTGGPPSRLPLTCRTTTQNILDSGNMQFSVNVGGTVLTSQQVPYNGGSTTATLAQALAGALPANSLVTVSYGGASSFTITTTATGSATSTTSVSMSIVSSCVASSTDTTSTACTQGWTSSQSEVAGLDQQTAPNSDTGTVTVSITANGTTYTKQSNYGGASTPGSVALDLYNQFNGDTTFSQLVRVTQPGTGGFAANAIGFTTVATGAATNYGLSVGSVTTDSNFAAGSTSFPISGSGSTFAPGQNGTLFDSGTVTLSVSGFSTGNPPSKQVTYGQGSNAPGIAAQLVSLVHNDPLFPVDATVPPGSAAISFTARIPGVSGNSYVVNIQGASSLAASFPTPSFASPATQAALGNGADPTYSLDSAVATHYTYDPRGMALQITKGAQTQSYVYDGLGRLTSVATPETNGPVQYTYTDFGAIHEQIDPRTLPGTSTAIKATYSYDTLGRVKTTTYNDSVTPTVTYNYDPPASAHNTGGRLSSISNAVETKAYQYDVMGRILQCLETIGSNSYTVGYSYAPDGMLSSLTYPSQKVVNFSYDPLDRLTQVMLGSTQNIFSISPSDYTAAGMPVKLSYGNNIVGQFGYNAQLQLSSIQYGAAAPATPLLSLNYLYGDGLDNGQIQGITDNVVAERSTSYKYDPLGQLVLAQTTDLAKPNTWKLAFNYDQYGNRLNEIPQAGAGTMPGNSVTVNVSSNRINNSGVTYDNAGNTVADGVNYYTFDAENRLVATSPVVGLGGASANFGYGPDGARVNNNGTYVIYAAGQPIAEYANGAASGNPTAEYINVNGNQVASIVGGALSFNFADHLSTRVNADINGVPNRTYGHFPFGETWYQTGASNKWDFTSYERDLNSSGLDYANARFYSSRLGRFLSVDQVLGSNRFAYVSNDPINLVDPTGMEAGCTTNPFSGSALPLCGPDQTGSAVGSNCGANFGNDGFSINFTSNCSSFSINLGNFGGVPFGDLGQTIHNTLATIINIDTCPAGQFECPADGHPLFGTPSCEPFCVMDVASAQPSLKDECLNRFYSSGIGKVVDFGSIGGLVPGWSPNASKNFKELATLGTLKYGGLKGVEKFATANDIVVIRSLNSIKMIPSAAGAGLNVGLHFLGKATGFLSLAATAFDLVTHFGCAIETGPASPEDYSGLSD